MPGLLMDFSELDNLLPYLFPSLSIHLLSPFPFPPQPMASPLPKIQLLSLGKGL